MTLYITPTADDGEDLLGALLVGMPAGPQREEIAARMRFLRADNLIPRVDLRVVDQNPAAAREDFWARVTARKTPTN